MSDMVTNCFVKRCDEQKQFVDEMKRCNATQAIICALSMADCAHAIRSLGYVQSVGTARCTHSRHTQFSAHSTYLLVWCCRKLLALREAIGAAEATKADVEVLCALPITLPRSCGMLDATVSTATRRGDDSRSHRLLQLSMGWLGSGVTAQCRTARCREDCTRSCERCTSETND